MRKLLIALLILFPGYLGAQVNWVYDMAQAQNLSIAQGKLIVIDFYASWCGPCKTMDKDMWSKTEMKQLSDSLIFLKIDVDKNRDLASKFNIRAIPHVIIITITDDIVWQRNGYMGSSSLYLENFRKMPGNVSKLNEKLLPFFYKTETIEDNFELGKAYQVLGKNQSDQSIKNIFLNLSDKQFKKVEKKDVKQSKEAELRILLNMVYDGKAEKVLAKFEKFPIDYFPENQNELINEIKTLCKQ